MIKNIIITAIGITVFVCSLLFVQGCMVIWSDEVFVGTLFKVVDANDLELIAEPNYLQIGSGHSKTKNDKIKGTAIIGGVPVVVETN